MIDNWCLKKELIDYVDKYSHMTCGYFVNEFDIEILRKKLIEDIVYYIKRHNEESSNISGLLDTEFTFNIITTINKRFGVESVD